MRIFITGIDGYLGWTLAQYLVARGHTVAGADAMLRREWVEEMNSQSAIPIYSREERIAAFKEHYGVDLDFREGDFMDYEFTRNFFAEFKPDTIVHLGQVPSAPYSMIDRDHTVFTQQNNVIGNLNILWAMKEVCPEAHLVKLGTMGEYGTPNIDIPEASLKWNLEGVKIISPSHAKPPASTIGAKSMTPITPCMPAKFGAYVPPISCKAWSLAHVLMKWAKIQTHAYAPASTLTNVSAQPSTASAVKLSSGIPSHYSVRGIKNVAFCPA